MSVFQAVSAALTGQDLGDRAVTDPTGIAAELAGFGWDAARIAAHRDDCVIAGQRWPHPVDASLRGDLGAAQVSAKVNAVRALLGLAGPVRLRNSAARPDRRDLELMNDRPPHHVQRDES